ncbi:Sec-independent protein translocase protein TatB [Helicobacter winghamensis]|uniref:Sec-independent protein translocase protein TatB homolog n=1 Tax=Helicobacter winghamensis TaxID=157268 RepID=A0A2N3PIV7_9HELI|nr:Sec-independent protein translocase protein TatB [Helicobacter winghamensis]EEO25317.1 twin arginine-targeting protein translocase TatB [Helicobacter winghamensis ATCC BAA-430]PKT76356.1 twin arginine-targeting protein translocase TatB [Helicobacter winghamensis]PKT76487.1 twin arginine-targeting protein translocase TatB [Helicobacter winghamensis]PKT76618.1 twin arginine-targeting protein translocase TatB [Helicobacter winghamensis]PKT80867.1 twin arginine-targeting protein translocase Tat
MFGMGFFEILMVAVVAIIFLGPEKLPKALVDMAKFFRAVKKTMEDAKESLDKEINLNKIKEEALAYKNSITQGAQNLTKELDLKTLELNENLLEDSNSKHTPQQTLQQMPQNKKNIQTSKQDSIEQKLESKPQNTKEVKLNTSNKTSLSFGENLKKES